MNNIDIKAQIKKIQVNGELKKHQLTSKTNKLEVKSIIKGYSEKGPQGLSAYQVAVKNGYEGTEEQWLLDLIGEKGEKGEQGLKGDTGTGVQYIWDGTQLGIKLTTDTEYTYVDLKGEQGPQGEKGKTGAGLTILGTLDSPDELPLTANEGNGYIINTVNQTTGNEEGHLWVYTAEGEWVNTGNIRGPRGLPGTTDYNNLENKPSIPSTFDNLADGETNKAFTATEKVKLSGIATGANNYTHPTNHPASIITQDSNNRFVTDAEKSSWSGKQDELVSATNIKTINGTSVLGSGDITTPNTTYSEITDAEIDAGTASTARTISGRRAKKIIDNARLGKQDTLNVDGRSVPYNSDITVGEPTSSILASSEVSPVGQRSLITRDNSGRAKINEPIDPQDIANKEYVDTELNNKVTGAGYSIEVVTSYPTEWVQDRIYFKTGV